ncbi:MAG: Sugar-binding transcriptional regulator, LacI family [Haloplasmataceae bacterium]|jgi:LacI family transcriptional regulator|nr:Sugar-binding transcriptional regulator, LacI family [Haloplasmataceae bacterium]
MVTIKDVAKLAGVSTATASYGLKNDSRVREGTKIKVVEAAKVLNYIPNGAARYLKTQKSNIVGVFLDGFSRPTYHKLLDGINYELDKHGYNIIVSSGKSAEQLMFNRQIDAAVIHDKNVKNETIKRVASDSFPILLLDRELKQKFVHEFTIENTNITYQLAKHLLEQGYRNIHFISGVTSYDNTHRYNGFVQAMEEFGVYNPENYYQGDFSIRSGYNIANNIIKNKKPMPEVFFCANDEMAVGAMDAIKENDLKIPKDIAVVGFDNVELAKYYSPSLTTIHVDRFMWGNDVANLIIALINKETDLSRFSKPSGRIIYRESCK